MPRMDANHRKYTRKNDDLSQETTAIYITILMYQIQKKLNTYLRKFAVIRVHLRFEYNLYISAACSLALPV